MKHTLLKPAILLALPILFTASPGAFADQSQEMEEVVVRGELSRYSATKSDTPILEVSRSISIESQQDLIDKGALTLADTYLYSAGVTGEQYGFATRVDSLAVRGLSVPEYRDSLQALFGSYNNVRPDVYNIEQVEVLKGPASVLYGKGSPGGIVNVVSKTPQAEAKHEITAEFGSFDRTQIAFDTTGPLTDDGSWLYRVVGIYRDSDTQVDFVDEKVVNLSPSITWRPNDSASLTLLVNHKDSEADVAAQFLPIFGTLEPAPNGETVDWDLYTGEPGFNHYDTRSTSITLLGDYQFTDRLSIEATVRQTEGESDYQQAWTSFIGGDRYIRNADGSLYENGTVPRTFYVADGTSDQFAIDVRARTDFMTGDIAHELMIGVQHQDVDTDTDSAYLFAVGLDFATGLPDATFGDRFWINVFDPVYTGAFPDQATIDLFYSDSPGSNTTDLGLYVNDQISWDRWSFSLGLRYDDVETDNGTTTQTDHETSFSAGALYAFDNGVSPYINYAESFNPVVGTDGISGESLKPREGEQVEVGIKYQPPGTAAFVTLARFDIEESNLSNPNALVGANSQQEGVSEVSGMELETYVPVGDFTFEFNVSLLDTENPDGARFASVPEKQASAWIGYEPNALPGFRSGLGLRYVGENFDGTDTLKTPGYTVVDLMLGYQVNNWQFSVNAQNLGDKEYISTCLARGDCFLGERRNVVGKARYQF